MRNPSECIVHLTMRYNQTVLAVGSGVIYKFEEDYYIVTAWHNVTGRHADTLEFLNEVAACPNNILATLQVSEESTGLSFRYSYVVPLEDEESTFYYVHSQGYPRIDIAAIPIDLKRQYKTEATLSTGERLEMNASMSFNFVGLGMAKPVPIQDFYPDDDQIRNDFLSRLAQADELFIPGYPEGITDYTGQPLWKRASIASSVYQGWDSEPKFLVDCASRRGMSGAPVLMYSKNGELKYGGSTYYAGRPVAVFAGVYSGRVGSKDLLEAQIGVVWNWKVVDGVLRSKKTGWHSSFLLASEREIDTAVAAVWPVDLDWNEGVLDDRKNHRYRLVPSVMKSLNGRASEKEVLGAVLRHAQFRISD